MPQNRTKTGQFVKGQSGNPGGRTKIDPKVIEILKAALPEMAERLVKLTESDDENVALKAILAAFERLFGKPVQASDVQMDVSGALDVRAQIHAALLEQAKQAKEHAE